MISIIMGVDGVDDPSPQRVCTRIRPYLPRRHGGARVLGRTRGNDSAVRP